MFFIPTGEPDYEEVGFPVSAPLRHQLCQLGRNARMLASQAPDRAAQANKVGTTIPDIPLNFTTSHDELA